MSNILDLNSDCSDSEDDCDYVPNEAEASEDSDAGVDEIGGKINQDTNSDNDEEKAPKLTPEEEKKRGDELFKKFLLDVEPDAKPERKICGDNKVVAEKNIEKITVTEEYDFAGETVCITKDVESSSAPINTTPKTQPSINIKPSSVNTSSTKRPGGLGSLLGAISKKPKMSILQKSLHDWKSFKKEEGIEEDLEHFNKGKGGYLEKQAFLQRSDLRQFEIEKNIRLSKKSKQ